MKLNFDILKSLLVLSFLAIVIVGGLNPSGFLTFTDSTFDTGTKINVQWVTDHLELSTGQTSGTYVSNVFDAGSEATWNSMSWTGVTQSGGQITYLYQENADSTSCSGLWQLGWKCSWIYDGDWETYAKSQPAYEAYVYFNYIKPENAIRESSKWHVKDKQSTVPDPKLSGIAELTLPQNCWDLNPIQLRGVSITTGVYGNWECYTGSSWTTLRSQSSGGELYEEAMNWAIDTGGTTSLSVSARSCSQPDCSDKTNWDQTGLTTSPSLLSVLNNRYFQYKVDFTTTDSDYSPEFSNVEINYEQKPYCGNNIIETGEVCDGSDLGSKTCGLLGFYSGALTCSSNCVGFDVSGCTNCGNDIINSGEECDTTKLNSKTCISLGYDAGTLSCFNCLFDISGCSYFGCGNNMQEGNEDCDKTDLAGANCSSVMGIGYTGTLSCADNCDFDTSGCIGPKDTSPTPTGNRGTGTTSSEGTITTITTQSKCGNGKCESNENSNNCPQDCKTSINQICTPLTKRCSGNEIEVCKKDGTKWVKLKECEAGCDSISLDCIKSEINEENIKASLNDVSIILNEIDATEDILEKVQELVDKARKAIDEGNFDSAIEYTMQAVLISESYSIIKGVEESAAEIKTGEDVMNLLDQAKQAFEAGDYATAKSLAEQAEMQITAGEAVVGYSPLTLVLIVVMIVGLVFAVRKGFWWI